MVNQKIEIIIENFKTSHYIMDRCFMWVVGQLKLLVKDFREYQSLNFDGELSHIKISLMRKELIENSLQNRILNIIRELNDEIIMIDSGVLIDGTKFKPKYKAEEIKFRIDLKEELDRFSKSFQKEDTEIDRLKIENALLKEKIKILEK